VEVGAGLVALARLANLLISARARHLQLHASETAACVNLGCLGIPNQSVVFTYCMTDEW